jgi:anti-anti-sigma factor
MPLKVTVEPRGGGAYFAVKPEGSIDANTYTALSAEVQKLLQKSPSLVIFDLEKVEFVSSAGIGVVLSAEKALKSKGGKALLVNLKPHIRKVFDIVKALPTEQVFNSVKEMDQYLAEMQRKVKEGE